MAVAPTDRISSQRRWADSDTIHSGLKESGEMKSGEQELESRANGQRKKSGE